MHSPGSSFAEWVTVVSEISVMVAAIQFKKIAEWISSNGEFISDCAYKARRKLGKKLLALAKILLKKDNGEKNCYLFPLLIKTVP